MPVYVDGIEYRAKKIQCYKSRGIYITMTIVNRHSNTNGVEEENREYVLRFTQPDRSWILDDSLVANVTFSPYMKTRLLQRNCLYWFWQSIISEQENEPPPGGPPRIN